MLWLTYIWYRQEALPSSRSCLFSRSGQTLPDERTRKQDLCLALPFPDRRGRLRCQLSWVCKGRGSCYHVTACQGAPKLMPCPRHSNGCTSLWTLFCYTQALCTGDSSSLLPVVQSSSGLIRNHWNIWNYSAVRTIPRSDNRFEFDGFGGFPSSTYLAREFFQWYGMIPVL